MRHVDVLVSSTASGLLGIALTTHGAHSGTSLGMVEIGVGAVFCLLALSLGKDVARSPGRPSSSEARKVAS